MNMKTAKIYTYSILFSSSEEFQDKVPYLSAILEMDDGQRFASLIEGYRPDMEIRIGQEVKGIEKEENGAPQFSF